jgi:hypothetical protein
LELRYRPLLLDEKHPMCRCASVLLHDDHGRDALRHFAPCHGSQLLRTHQGLHGQRRTEEVDLRCILPSVLQPPLMRGLRCSLHSYRMLCCLLFLRTARHIADELHQGLNHNRSQLLLLRPRLQHRGGGLVRGLVRGNLRSYCRLARSHHVAASLFVRRSAHLARRGHGRRFSPPAHAACAARAGGVMTGGVMRCAPRFRLVCTPPFDRGGKLLFKRSLHANRARSQFRARALRMVTRRRIRQAGTAQQPRVVE